MKRCWKKWILVMAVMAAAVSISACTGNRNPAVGQEKNGAENTIPTRDTGEITMSFYAGENGYFYKNGEKVMSLFYIKGVNMGLTEATTDLANPNVDYDTYYEWFEEIAAMNANTVRVFSIMNPNFYEALDDYNSRHRDEPLFLIQGIWFSEDLMNQLTDALESDGIIVSAFERSVKETLDIVHGSSSDTVYGEFSPAVYDRDISKYVVGYILGLEYPASFVMETNASHPDQADYTGTYLATTKEASPFEAFLCRIGDCLIDYETVNYKCQTPVAFLNWQTLDVMTHPNEPYAEEEDAVSVNTEHIVSNKKYYPGLFAAVDVYPYYPEFMNHQESYLSFRNEEGEQNVFRAYLAELKQQYTVPLLIAEYGLSTSRGVAHRGTGGYQQGGLTEDEQGELNARMTRDIAREGCCGGLLFSWQDEWFKRTWNTVMYYPDDPTLRTHNLSSAEQSYGILSFDVSDVWSDGVFTDWAGVSEVGTSGVAVQYDVDYMQLCVTLPEHFNFDTDTYYVPISTLGIGSRTNEELGLTFSENCDFLLVINGKENTRLLCDAYYDVFHYKYGVLKGVFGESSAIRNEQGSGIYDRIYTYTSNEMYLPVDDVTLEPQYYEGGLLRYGNANPKTSGYCSQADFCYSDGKVEIRLAWYLLNVMNPQTSICIDEFDGEDIGFSEFTAIRIGGGMSGNLVLEDAGYTPVRDVKVRMRLKKSYQYMKKTFAKIRVGQ